MYVIAHPIKYLFLSVALFLFSSTNVIIAFILFIFRTHHHIWHKRIKNWVWMKHFLCLDLFLWRHVCEMACAFHSLIQFCFCGALFILWNVLTFWSCYDNKNYFLLFMREIINCRYIRDATSIIKLVTLQDKQWDHFIIIFLHQKNTKKNRKFKLI